MELKICALSKLTALNLMLTIHMVYFRRFSCSDFVTFVEKENLIGNADSAFQNFTFNNTKVKLRHEVLSREKGLWHVIEKLSEVRNDAETSKAIKTSYVGEKTGNIIQEVFASSNEEIVPVGTSSCSKVCKELLDAPTSCKKYKAIYIDAMKALMKDWFMWPLIVMAEEDPCIRSFADTLMKDLEDESLRVGQQEPRRLYFHKVARNSTITKSVSRILYKATSSSATTIILLCSDDVAKLIFRMSKPYKDLHSHVVWITLESHIEGDSSPSLLLKLETEGNMDHLMPSFDVHALAMLSLKAATMMQNDGMQSITSYASSTKNGSRSTMSNFCHTKKGEAPTVLVSFSKQKTHWLPMYRWSSDSKMTLLSSDTTLEWLSRSHAHKPKLSVVSILETPFAKEVHEFYEKATGTCIQGALCRIPTATKNGTDWHTSCCLGFLMELLEELQHDLWLSMDVYIVEDGFYGSLVNGTWNGLVGDLIKGDADMIIAPITATAKRSKVIDFSAPYMETSLAIIVLSNTETKLNFINFSFVANISQSNLLVLAAIFIFAVFFIFLLENTSRSGRKSEVKRFYNFKDGFSYISGIIFQRDVGGKNPSQTSARIIFVPFAFAMVIIMSTYTATLTAVKVKNEDRDIIQGLRDKRLSEPSNDFKYGTFKSSSTEGYFKDSQDQVLNNMYFFMRKYSTETVEHGVEQVYKGELKAFILELPVAQYHVSTQKDCALTLVKTKSGKSTWNLAFRRGSSWNSVISKKISEYKERGYFTDLYAKWMQSKCTETNGAADTNNKFSVEYFGGWVVILAGSFLFCSLLLLLEHYFHKQKRNSSKYSLEEPQCERSPVKTHKP